MKSRQSGSALRSGHRQVFVSTTKYASVVTLIVPVTARP
jgi:hypothetical protein